MTAYDFMSDSIASTTSALAEFVGEFLTEAWPWILAILGVIIVIGFSWKLVHRFTGR